MQITIKTSQFEFAHGKKPRGVGYWHFQLAGTNLTEGDKEFVFNGSYGEAVKALRKRMTELRSFTAVVLS